MSQCTSDGAHHPGRFNEAAALLPRVAYKTQGNEAYESELQ